jgi:hypothetical protein
VASEFGLLAIYVIVRSAGGLYSLKMPRAIAAKKNGGFDPGVFLATIGIGRKILVVPKKQAIFAQGDEIAIKTESKGTVWLRAVAAIEPRTLY